jgi:hypothetical protein
MVTLLKKGLVGTLMIATTMLGSAIVNPKAAEAQVLIGGGGTCAPHQAFDSKTHPYPISNLV